MVYTLTMAVVILYALAALKVCLDLGHAYKQRNKK